MDMTKAEEPRRTNILKAKMAALPNPPAGSSTTVTKTRKGATTRKKLSNPLGFDNQNTNTVPARNAWPVNVLYFKASTERIIHHANQSLRSMSLLSRRGLG
ncbi:hypothetical protein C4578_01980 [Candidatus Microgenomates bacterium]|nr:MAG: hypothetical protein C4578_01980 [Candidatus Microgenomates bacterium]